jgi:Tfp pilus assembly protein PilF
VEKQIEALPLDPEESVLVESAMHALRLEGRVEQARRLLDQYLERFPHGALTEDATALEIEGALAAHDSIAAQRWAARYQERFPKGRFTTFADQVRNVDLSKAAGPPHP